MKFASSIVLAAAAAATAALAAPQHDTTAAANPHSATASSNAHTAASTSTAAAAHSTSAQEPDIQIPYGSTNALWTILPADPTAWAVIAAPGVFNTSAHFSIKDQDKAVATFTAPRASLSSPLPRTR